MQIKYSLLPLQYLNLSTGTHKDGSLIAFWIFFYCQTLGDCNADLILQSKSADTLNKSTSKIQRTAIVLNMTSGKKNEEKSLTKSLVAVVVYAQ